MHIYIRNFRICARIYGRIHIYIYTEDPSCICMHIYGSTSVFTHAYAKYHSLYPHAYTEGFIYVRAHMKGSLCIFHISMHIYRRILTYMRVHIRKDLYERIPICTRIYGRSFHICMHIYKRIFHICMTHKYRRIFCICAHIYKRVFCICMCI